MGKILPIFFASILLLNLTRNLKRINTREIAFGVKRAIKNVGVINKSEELMR